MQDLSVVQLRVLGRQEDETWRNLAWLSRTSQLRILAKLIHLFLWPRSCLDGCMDRTRGNSIDSYAPADELLG